MSLRAAAVRTIACLALLTAVPVRAAEDLPLAATPTQATGGLADLSLEELFAVQVRVTTRTPRPLRTSPGVVTVVTREEILASGARDLIDVLHLVPGFAFGVDVQGAVGVGFRGNWGTEGKVLLLLDGQELNETLYLTTQFGNHVPVEHIERVEIARGPGSVVYGGYAELAVIHVITRSAADLQGVSAAGQLGAMEDALGRANLHLAVGQVLPALDGLAVSAAATLGTGRRSDRTYRDLSGTAYSLRDADMDPRYVNAAVSWRGAQVRYVFDGYRLRSRDAFDESLAKAVVNDFDSHHVEARYDWQPRAGLTVTPRLQYKRQTPWRVTDLPAGEPLFYDKTADRLTGGVLATWDATARLQLLAGAEAAYDRAWLNDLAHVGVGLQQPFGERTRHHYTTLAGYAQALFDHRLALVSLGARYEHNSGFGGAFLPRVGLTRSIGPWHAKLLYSRAFKAPGHENFGLNPDIGPERTTTWELETGYRVGEHVYVGANLFDISIRDPIIFFFDAAAGGESYVNFSRAGTRGVEVETRLKLAQASAHLTWSYYTAAGRNEVPVYAVPGQRGPLRALPQHKGTASATVPLGLAGLRAQPSAVLLGPRYGTLGARPDGTARVGREDPALLLDLFLTLADRPVRGLEIGAGVHDLLDQGVRFLQPHDSDHAPLPGPTREWVLRLAYTHALR